MRIFANYVGPPIPIRTHDWCAYDADTFDPEGSHPIGWGRTRQEAIDDLLRQIEEVNDDGA